MPSPWSAILRPNTLLHNRRPMWVDVVVHAAGFINHECTDSFRIERLRDADGALRSGRKKDERCRGVAICIVYRSERDALSFCHFFYRVFYSHLVLAHIS